MTFPGQEYCRAIEFSKAREGDDAPTFAVERSQ